MDRRTSGNRVGPTQSEPIVFRRLDTGEDVTTVPGGNTVFTVSEGQQFRDLAMAGNMLQSLKDYKGALKKYEEALEQRPESNETLGYTYSAAGLCALALGDYHTSQHYHLQHLNVAQRAGDRGMECIATCNRGISLSAEGKHEDAIRSLEISLRLAGILSNERAKMRAHANLGNTYSAMGNFEKATEHHEHQLRIARTLGDNEAEARASHNLQNDHNSMNRYQLAKTFHHAKEVVYASRNDEGVILGNFGTNLAHEDVRSGWVIKHHGGKPDKPDKLSKTKKLLVLNNGVLSYHKDAKSKKALRYVPVEDLMQVEKWGGRTFEAEKNLKVVTIHRTFWFTCENAEECNAWMTALSEDLAVPAHHATMRASEAHRQPRKESTQATVFNNVSLMGVDEEHKFQNPAFQEDAEAETDEFDAVVRTLQHRGSHRGHTNEEDAEAIFANDEELYEDGAISADSTFTLPVFPLGTFPMDVTEDDERPSTSEIRTALHDFVSHVDRSTLVKHSITVDDAHITTTKQQQTTNQIQLTDVCATEVLDNNLVVVLRTPPFTVHVFDCLQSEKAKKVRGALRDKGKTPATSNPQTASKIVAAPLNSYDSPQDNLYSTHNAQPLYDAPVASQPLYYSTPQDQAKQASAHAPQQTGNIYSVPNSGEQSVYYSMPQGQGSQVPSSYTQPETQQAGNMYSAPNSHAQSVYYSMPPEQASQHPSSYTQPESQQEGHMYSVPAKQVSHPHANVLPDSSYAAPNAYVTPSGSQEPALYAVPAHQQGIHTIDHLPPNMETNYASQPATVELAIENAYDVGNLRRDYAHQGEDPKSANLPSAVDLAIESHYDVGNIRSDHAHHGETSQDTNLPSAVQVAIENNYDVGNQRRSEPEPAHEGGAPPVLVKKRSQYSIIRKREPGERISVASLDDDVVLVPSGRNHSPAIPAEVSEIYGDDPTRPYTPNDDFVYDASKEYLPVLTPAEQAAADRSIHHLSHVETSPGHQHKEEPAHPAAHDSTGVYPIAATPVVEQPEEPPREDDEEALYRGFSFSL